RARCWRTSEPVVFLRPRHMACDTKTNTELWFAVGDVFSTVRYGEGAGWMAGPEYRRNSGGRLRRYKPAGECQASFGKFCAAHWHRLHPQFKDGSATGLRAQS